MRKSPEDRLRAIIEKLDELAIDDGRTEAIDALADQHIMTALWTLHQLTSLLSGVVAGSEIDRVDGPVGLRRRARPTEKGVP